MDELVSETELLRRAKISAYMRGAVSQRPLGAGRGRLPGFKHSPETIAKMSKKRGPMHTAAFKARLRALRTGSSLSAEHRAKIGAAHLGKVRSLEAKQRMGESARRQDVRAKLSISARTSPLVLAARSARLRLKGPTQIELVVRDVLTAAGVPFLFQHPVGRYVADFVLPGKNLILECDGRYWHSLPGAKERDARRDAYLTKLGYRVIRLPEHRIKGGVVALLAEMVS